MKEESVFLKKVQMCPSSPRRMIVHGKVNDWNWGFELTDKQLHFIKEAGEKAYAFLIESKVKCGLLALYNAETGSLLIDGRYGEEEEINAAFRRYTFSLLEYFAEMF